MPGADELFRSTSPAAISNQAMAVGGAMLAPRADRLRAVPDPAPDVVDEQPGEPDPALDDGTPAIAQSRRRHSSAPRGASGRERHDEKITVYVSPDELLGLEQARVTLRARHGLGVDRGRIVREALDLILADFDERGPDSLLVRALREH